MEPARVGGAVTVVIYLLQTAVLGGGMVLISQQLRDELTRFVGVLFSCFWTIVVAGIFLVFGEEQAIFYSSDQVHHVTSILKLRISGLSAEPTEILGYRYVISVPATLLNLVGIHPLLAFKFIQGTCVLVLLSVATTWITSQLGFMPRWGYVLLISPSLLLNSVLALRDTALAAAVVVMMLHPRWRLRVLAAFAAFGLRPQMMIALLVGMALAFVLQGRGPIVKALTGLAAFLIGRVLLDIASQGAFRNPATSTFDLLTQVGVSRLLLSMVGLQFLSVNPDTVNLEFLDLFLLRFIFFDTWLIPLSFTIVALLVNVRQYRARQVSTTLFFSFCAYIGVASQTDFTSSRQSMPFFACMGSLLLVAMATGLKPHQVESLDRDIGVVQR
jgi:hypothetical protein